MKPTIRQLYFNMCFTWEVPHFFTMGLKKVLNILSKDFNFLGSKTEESTSKLYAMALWLPEAKKT